MIDISNFGVRIKSTINHIGMGQIKNGMNTMENN